MTKRIHLAKTGSFRDSGDRAVTVDADLLAEMAEGYNTGAHKAPLVLGHPTDGAPAYGWVEKLEVGEDGDLYGIIDQVAPDLAEAVEAGKYRNVSISWWPKGHSNSPDKTRASLRHVGILGAQAPVVKGLTPLQFAEDQDGIVTVEFSEAAFGWRVMGDMARSFREFIIDKFGTEDADRLIPAYTLNTFNRVAEEVEDKSSTRFADAVPKPALQDPPETSEEPAIMPSDKDTTTDLAEREAKLAEREAKIAKLEADNAAAAAAAQKGAAISFADALIKDGKLAPAGKDVVVDIHARLAGANDPISFSDGTSKPALGAFEELLKGGNKIVDLSEASKDDRSSATLKAGDPVGLTARANAIQKENPAISFSEAVRKAEEEASK